MGKPGNMTAVTGCAASIDYDMALAILAAHAAPLDAASVSLADAGGCYLARPVHARVDSPRFDCAAMDGYAVRERDLVDGITTLKQVGISYAGSGDAGGIGAGETMRVMTGAPLPRGADRVIMIEYCRGSDTGVEIEDPPLGKPHIRRRGSDFSLGELLLPEGSKVTPASIIAAAAGDHGRLSVPRRPRVQLLATGDEILAPGSAAGKSFSIPDSLTAAIELLCASAGARVVSKIRLADDPETIASAGQAASADIIVILGGASRGDRDYGRAAFAPFGLEIAFADVNMKPGKPVWYGKAGAAHILGLPGNPAAALTIARLFLAPLITGLLGGEVADALPWQLLPAAGPIEENGSREAFLCGTTSHDGVDVRDRQGASGQARLAHANVLVRRRAHAAPVLRGMLAPMLLALLMRAMAQPLVRKSTLVVADATPAGTTDAVLRDLARRISDGGGGEVLTGPEKLIWNTAVVVFFMTGDRRIGVPPDAKVLSWGAARAGFREMGLPALAEFVRLFVLELAYRADLDARDREANSASLRRIAELRGRFQAIEAEIDFPHELSRMIARVYQRR